MLQVLLHSVSQCFCWQPVLLLLSKSTRQSRALVWPLYPCACKEETLSCVMGLEEKSKTFLDAFSPLYQAAIAEAVGRYREVLNVCSDNCL